MRGATSRAGAPHGISNGTTRGETDERETRDRGEGASGGASRAAADERTTGDTEQQRGIGLRGKERLSHAPRGSKAGARAVRVELQEGGSPLHPRECVGGRVSDRRQVAHLAAGARAVLAVQEQARA